MMGALMVTYPVSVRRNSYRGGDRKKQMRAATENELAARIEKYVNDLLFAQEQPIAAYLFHDIASATGIDYDIVRRLGYSIDGGSNGFTSVKRGMTLEEAWAAMKSST
jgi:hypothetical protein